MDATLSFKKLNNGTDNALMIKCRVAGNKDNDFIEVEVALPTFSNSLQSCCEELQINSDCVYMLCKLPNVVIVFNANVLLEYIHLLEPMQGKMPQLQLFLRSMKWETRLEWLKRPKGKNFPCSGQLIEGSNETWIAKTTLEAFLLIIWCS